MNTLRQLISFTGALLLLACFALNTTGVVSTGSLWYIAGNVIGALIIGVIALQDRNWSLVVTEVFWIGIALLGPLNVALGLPPLAVLVEAIILVACGQLIVTRQQKRTAKTIKGSAKYWGDRIGYVGLVIQLLTFSLNSFGFIDPESSIGYHVLNTFGSAGFVVASVVNRTWAVVFSGSAWSLVALIKIFSIITH